MHTNYFRPQSGVYHYSRGLDLFTKGLVEAGVNKDLIKNEYLLSKMTKGEYEMPQSDSDVESESGEEDRKSDKSDNESEYDDDDGDDNEEDDNDDDNEDDDESEKLACNHCGKETGHIVYLMKCPRCSWKDFYWGKNSQCMICDEQLPLLFSHVIGFWEYVRMVRLTARRVEWSSHQKWTNKRPSRLDRT